MQTNEDYEKEEWGGWKIISDMLDNPDELGIYPTGEAYQKLYNFVVEQKQKALSLQKQQMIEKGEELNKTGNNGENLPFENSPQIYGNQRIESYKKGYNQALTDYQNLIRTSLEKE